MDQDKACGCLMGVMIGDSLGAPFEIFTPEQILQATHGKGIVGFSKYNERKRKHAPTDDYQLTEAILRSIIRRKDFDIHDIALAHIEALDTTDYGWGGGTRDGVRELDEYFSTLGKAGRSPLVAPVPEPMKGLGNGVAMKIAAVALLEAIRHPAIKDKKAGYHKHTLYDYVYLPDRVAAIGKLTHSDPRAWAAAYAVALIIVECLLFGQYPEFLQHKHEKRILLDRVIKKVARFETKYVLTRPPPYNREVDNISNKLQNLNDALMYGPIETLRTAVGTGCVSLESVCFSIALFFRNTREFKTGLLEAVNSGGDCDSTTSILGAMIGSVVGLKGIPKELIIFNQEFEKATKLGEEFYITFG